MSPTVRHRRLSRELQQLREQAGLSPDEAARQLNWSRSKMSRVENARLLLNTGDIANACDLYGADSATKANLIQLGKDARRRGWWMSYKDVFNGNYVALEAEATTIRTWEPLLIPGLLQSDGYARSIIKAARPQLSEDEVNRRVDARMTRKVRLLGEQAPVFHAIVDEYALVHPVGPAGVMTRQLDELCQIAKWQHAIIQVLPMRTNEHVGMEGAFSVLSFEEEDPDVGYVGCPGGEIYIEAADQVRDLKVIFERLAELALPPQESAAFIAAVKE
ncbi:helix-turn-helix domain-containing protein [Streptosporangium jomthongense]|uniref:Helix-turn-helix domain-containing protein n=1 Tax=Streptosporangium jomthongense TaxID=1193683 RepID=A0ABV8F9X9_9ACTN